MDDEDGKGFAWESGYAEGIQLGDVVAEDESGSIERAIERVLAEQRRQTRASRRPANVRLGIMRQVYVVLDCSRAATNKAMLPSRLLVATAALVKFVDKFYEQNPISQIGIIICRDRRARRLLSLTGSTRAVKETLRGITESQCDGEFSLQNVLQLALTNLKDIPGHSSKEVLLIMSALSSCDPGNIHSTIDALVASGIRCSVVGLCAEVYICKRLAERTSGRMQVVLDADHLQQVLASHTRPATVRKGVEASMLRVGFPARKPLPAHRLCECHASETAASTSMSSPSMSEWGYECVQCGARHCELPAECRVCRLTLVAAPQLARALHHLTPLTPFEELELAGDANAPSSGKGASSSSSCYACGAAFKVHYYRCPSCKETFCGDCDQFLHEALYVCPGCQYADVASAAHKKEKAK